MTPRQFVRWVLNYTHPANARYQGVGVIREMAGRVTEEPINTAERAAAWERIERGLDRKAAEYRNNKRK